MMHRFVLAFLTFVLISPLSAGAAPQVNPSMQEPKPEESSPADSSATNLDSQQMVISTPPEPIKKVETYEYYPYKQSISPRIGIIFDSDLMKEHKFPYLLGFLYMLPRRRSPQMEAGADILSDSRGQLHFGLRNILYERQYFRPYFRAGISLEVEPDDQLAAAVDFENYQLRFSLGFEDVVKLPMSARFEIEGSISSTDQTLYLVGGYSWAW